MAIEGVSTTPASLFTQKSTGPPCSLKNVVQSIFDTLLDCLLLIGYIVQHALYCLLTIDCFTEKGIFGGRILCHTRNFGRWEELPLYVELKRNPISIDEKVYERAKSHGFEPTRNPIIPKPHTEGHCFGNVALFLRKWLETYNIEEVLPYFRGGSPLEGAQIQKVYEKLYTQRIYYTFVVTSLCQILDGSSTVAQEREKWSQKKLKEEEPILDAVEGYLNSDKSEGLVSFMKKWLQQKGHPFEGKMLASALTAAEKSKEFDDSEKERMEAALEYSGLKIESVIHYDRPPQEILKSLETASCGAYKMSHPVYTHTGEHQGEHAIGVIITEEICFILESNSAIGWCRRDELTTMIGRLYTECTGLNFSQKQEGEFPSFGTRVGNFIKERANPSPSGPRQSFSLMKVKLP